jgi:hypothetical protein
MLKMKKLFMHIGLGKTGSSALQSWLSLNAEAISRQGVDYADLVPQAKKGEVSSGNGYPLHKACVSQDFEEVERLLNSTYFFTRRNQVALISCELFQGLRMPLLEKLKDTFIKCDIDVTIIVYVRSIYEQLYSTYLQGIKRASIAHRFGEEGTDLVMSRSVQFLKKFVTVFGDRVLAVNYDDAKDDIYASMAGIIGIENNGLKTLKKKVNRSLTLEEAEVLRRMNSLHGGVFATSLSDFVVKLSPNVDTPVYYDASLVRKVKAATEEDLLWINEQFTLSSPVVSDYYDGRSHTKPISLTRDSYKPVIQWVKDFDPGPAKRREFVAFLRDLTVQLLDVSVDDALAVKKVLKKVQLQLEKEVEQECLQEAAQLAAQGAQRPNAPKAGQGNPAVKRASVPAPAPHPKLKPNHEPPVHMIAYFYDTEIMNPEDGFLIDSRLMDWLKSLQIHAVGGIVNPIERKHRVHGDNRVATDERYVMAGYTLVKLDDLEKVLSLARTCPLLEVGIFLEVSRIVNLFPMGPAAVTMGKARA